MRQTRPSGRTTTPSARPDQSRPPSSLVSWLAGAARREPSAEGGREKGSTPSVSVSVLVCSGLISWRPRLLGSGGVLSFPYVAIKSGARSPTPSLLPRSLLFFLFFWNSPSSAESREEGSAAAAAAGTHAGGRARAGDLFRLQETVRSILRCSALIRESISRSTSDSETAKFRGRRSVYVSLSSSTSPAAPLLFPTAPKLTMQT